MNSSNLEHFFLFSGAMFMFRILPAWAYCTIAALLIELDQARSSGAWIAHFCLPDTLLDLAADALAIIILAVLLPKIFPSLAARKGR